MDLTFATFKEITSAVKSKKISAVEVAQHFLNRIELLDKKLNAYILINDKAIIEAQLVDEKNRKGHELGPLAGVPFGIKDMLCTKNLQTTAGSKILENFIPPYDSTVVKKLRDAGATVLGKLNQDEFAMGSSNEASFFGSVKNPWNLSHVPGGSSGGSAAAQASRIAAGTIGTDTGGSIRQPASFCGVVGVKPTYGRVSRYGIVAFASSLDQAGPIVSSVEDAAITLEAICGHDNLDGTSSQKKVPSFSAQLNENIKGLKIGVLEEAHRLGLDIDVEKTVQNGIETLKKLGAEVVPISMPLLEYSIPVYYLIAASEASSNLARYDGVRFGFRAKMHESAASLEDFYSHTRGEGFGREVQRRIMIGTFCLSSGYFDAYYTKACQVRRLIKNQYDEAFTQCDIILSPVASAPAFKIGDKISDPLAMYLNDIFTTSTNLAGLPGMSVPFGLSKDRLPIGLQLTAQAFEEQKMLNVGLALERASSIAGEKPYVI
jgi:aspartyl-tRNA(Asn)/glutamyl-tRNA(Gln) amidotransferase subunit A